MASPWSGGAQVRIKGEIHGQQTVNVLHFATNMEQFDGPNVDTILQALANAVKECILETFLPAVTSDWTFKGVDARRLKPTPSDPFEVAADPGAVGELSAASTSFISSLIQIRTGGGGKKGRGRIYMPPAGETQIANSAIDAPTLILIAAFCACMAGKFIGESPSTAWRLGVLSRVTLAGNIANFDTAFREATSLVPVADAAVMRSRRKGHGA